MKTWRYVTFVMFVAATAAAQPSQTAISYGSSAPTNPMTTAPMATTSPAVHETTTSSPASTSSIHPAALQGQASQNGGAGANNAAGAALIAAGVPLLGNPPTAPMGAALIAMGMIALAQGSHDSGAAGQSGMTAGYSTQGNMPTDSTNPAFSNGTSGFNSNPQLAQGQSALQNAGYSMTPAGLKNPDGSITPASAFNSPSSMAAAGMDAGTISGIQKELKKVNANIGSMPHVVAMGVDNKGGAGGMSAGGSSGGDGFTLPSFTNPFALNKSAQAKLVAGKTVNYDGQPIGVSRANIFDMISSCYQRKRQAHNFIEDGSVPTRLPASINH